MGSYWDASGKLVDGRYEAILKSSGGVEPTIGGYSAADSWTGGNQIGISSFGLTFNETSWDRQRGNTQGTLLASAARTASTGTAVQTNYNGRGVLVYLNITAASGTGGLQIIIRSNDPVSGSAILHNVSPTGIIAIGTYAYELYPGSSAAGAAGSNNVNQRTSGALPRTWYVVVSHIDASSYTYSVGYSIIL